jgi:uncharacterized protein (DUF2267 family)
MANEKDSSVLESAVADVHGWLGEICDRLDWTSRRAALAALRAALHVLRDRLTVEQNAHLSAQLPLIVRGLYYEGWRPGHAAAMSRHVDVYLEHIWVQLGEWGLEADAEQVARAVYGVVARHIDEGEVRKVGATLPRGLRQLWEDSKCLDRDDAHA